MTPGKSEVLYAKETAPAIWVMDSHVLHVLQVAQRNEDMLASIGKLIPWQSSYIAIEASVACSRRHWPQTETMPVGLGLERWRCGLFSW